MVGCFNCKARGQRTGADAQWHQPFVGGRGSRLWLSRPICLLMPGPKGDGGVVERHKADSRPLLRLGMNAADDFAVQKHVPHPLRQRFGFHAKRKCMVTPALEDNAAAVITAPLDLTSLARRAGIPHRTFASPRLAERYGLTPDTPVDERMDLYDLVWATRLALTRLVSSRHRCIGGDEYYDIEFWSYLPGSSEPTAVVITAVLKAAHTESATLHLALPGELPEPKPPLVFVVDDDENVARCLRLGLERCGFEVQVAAHARAAREALQEPLPAAIVLDVDMPGVSGLELCRQLKADSRTASIPVVFCSGNYEARSVALQAGGAAFVEKPVGLLELAQCLRRVLQQPPAAKTPNSQKP